MTKTLIVFEESSEWEGVFHQELWDPDKKSCLFSVSNLWECPEDLEEFIENYLNEWKPVQKDQEKE